MENLPLYVTIPRINRTDIGSYVFQHIAAISSIITSDVLFYDNEFMRDHQAMELARKIPGKFIFYRLSVTLVENNGWNW